MAWDADKFFGENIQILGLAPNALGQISDPEKYNLYRGLSKMAQELSALHKQLSDMQQQLKYIERDLRHIKNAAVDW
jgi:hypothetical protein